MNIAPVARPTSPSLTTVVQAYTAYHHNRGRGVSGAALRVATWRPIEIYMVRINSPQEAFAGARRLATRMLHIPPPTPEAADLAQWGITTALQPHLPEFSDYKDAVCADFELAPETMCRGAGILALAPWQFEGETYDLTHAAVYARLGALWGSIGQAVPCALATFSALGPQERQTKILLDQDPGHCALRAALRHMREGAHDPLSSSTGIYWTPRAARAVDVFAQLEGGWLAWAQSEGLMTWDAQATPAIVPSDMQRLLTNHLLLLIEQVPECNAEAWFTLMLREEVGALAACGPQQRLAFADMQQEAVLLALDASIAIATPHTILPSNG